MNHCLCLPRISTLLSSSQKMQSFLGPTTNNRSIDLERILQSHFTHSPILKQSLGYHRGVFVMFRLRNWAEKQSAAPCNLSFQRPLLLVIKAAPAALLTLPRETLQPFWFDWGQWRHWRHSQATAVALRDLGESLCDMSKWNEYP